MNRSTQLPFFVYGTLRPGHGNHRRLLDGRTTSEIPATVQDIALYGHGVPFAVRQTRAVTTGALIAITPNSYRSTVSDLDTLEGYRPGRHSLYVRKTITAVTAEGHTKAWIYLAGDPDEAIQLGDPVPGNDWELALTR